MSIHLFCENFFTTVNCGSLLCQVVCHTIDFSITELECGFCHLHHHFVYVPIECYVTVVYRLLARKQDKIYLESVSIMSLSISKLIAICKPCLRAQSSALLLVAIPMFLENAATSSPAWFRIYTSDSGSSRVVVGDSINVQFMPSKRGGFPLKSDNIFLLRFYFIRDLVHVSLVP